MYDELKERCRTCSQGCIYPSECSYFDKPPLRCMRQLLSEAADAIEELSKRVDDSIPKSDAEIIIAEVAKPKWIPVTERLPEPFDRVIVYDKRWGVLSAMKGYDDSWGGRNDIVIEKVTHWMPLPQPPKEG